MRNPRISLRFKVALSVSLLLLAVAGAVAAALIRYESIFLTREGEKRVQSLAEHLALNALDPLLARDELRLAPLIQSVMRDPDALYAFVVDHEGRVVHHSDTRLIGRKAPAGTAHRAGRALRAERPILAEGTLVGTAVVGLGPEFIDAAMRATAAGLLLPLGVGTLIGMGGIFLLTGLHVRRIEKLEHAVRAFGGGDMGVLAQVGGRDEVSRLAAHFNDMVERLREAQAEIERNFTETVSALAAAIEAKDAYTRGHCERVARLSCAIAERIGVEPDDLRDLRLAAILHDVGKIGVRAQIIGKVGRLTDEEMEEMKTHPEIGATILSPLSYLRRVATYVRHHHEDFDGSGYPAGLAGEEIPLASRIIHLVDAYDAMTSTRPYRSALPHEEALRRIRAAQRDQFDPRLVELFIELDREGLVAAIRKAVQKEEAA